MMNPTYASLRLFSKAALSCLVLLLGAWDARSAEPEWQVGLAQVKITPPWPVVMAGYAGRDKPFEKVETDLYAKALALKDRQGQLGVLVTSDLLGFSAAVAEPICARLQQKIGLRREQILLNSAHIHTGPQLSLNPKGRESQAAGDVQRTVEYTRQLQDQIVDLVAQAVSHLEPAQLSWSVGSVPL